MTNRPYPSYLAEHGFTFVNPIPGTDKLPIRPLSSGGRSNRYPLTAPQFAKVKRNLRTGIRASSAEDIENALDWYPAANRAVAAVDPHDIEKGAGVVAALSGGGTEWERNLYDARHFLRHGVLPEGSKATDFQREQAQRIREGEHFSEVLPRGLKTETFARAIVNPEGDYPVIDTHMAHIAGGLKQPWKTDLGLGTVGRYRTISDALKQVSEEESLPVPAAQAAAWTYWKNMPHPHRGSIRASHIVLRSRDRG